MIAKEWVEKVIDTLSYLCDELDGKSNVEDVFGIEEKREEEIILDLYLKYRDTNWSIKETKDYLMEKYEGYELAFALFTLIMAPLLMKAAINDIILDAIKEAIANAD